MSVRFRVHHLAVDHELGIGPTRHRHPYRAPNLRRIGRVVDMLRALEVGPNDGIIGSRPAG